VAEAKRHECLMRKGPMSTTNARAAARRDRARIEEIKLQIARRVRAQEAGGVLVEGDDWVSVTFADKPERSILEALRAAGFHWGAGRWSGDRARLPESLRAHEPAYVAPVPLAVCRAVDYKLVRVGGGEVVMRRPWGDRFFVRGDVDQADIDRAGSTLFEWPGLKTRLARIDGARAGAEPGERVFVPDDKHAFDWDWIAP